MTAAAFCAMLIDWWSGGEGRSMCSIFSNIPREAYACETRSVRLGGHATSVRLEKAYWTVLERLAANEGMPLGRFLTELHDEVLELHGHVGNFASLLRCVCLMQLERAHPGVDASRPAEVQRRALADA